MMDSDAGSRQSKGNKIEKDDLNFASEAEQAQPGIATSAITDEQAEQMLPHYALALEYYHLRRLEGKLPEEALEMTLSEWRALWRASAFVPHRR